MKESSGVGGWVFLKMSFECCLFFVEIGMCCFLFFSSFLFVFSFMVWGISLFLFYWLVGFNCFIGLILFLMVCVFLVSMEGVVFFGLWVVLDLLLLLFSLFSSVMYFVFGGMFVFSYEVLGVSVGVFGFFLLIWFFMFFC